jgi:uncharacterized protein with PQ loop repeat
MVLVLTFALATPIPAHAPTFEFAPYVGGMLFLASLPYIPQVWKAWPRGSTGDLSLGMLTALTLGLALWIVYGALRGDCDRVCQCHRREARLQNP